MDEWVHCPAARLSSPSAIQVGNWVLIECNVREEKQQEQMQTQKKKKKGRLFYIQQVHHVTKQSVSITRLSKSDTTSLVFAAIIHSPFFLSLLSSTL